MGEQETSLLRRTEGIDQHKRYETIVAIERDALKDTALVQNKEWTPQDVVDVRNYLIRVAPYSHERVMPSYWEHILTASLYGRELAKAVGSAELLPEEAESLDLLHDCGSLIVPHRYYRKDIVTHTMEAQGNFRPEVMNKQPSLGRILGIEHPPVRSIDDLTLPQKINHIADNLGRRGAGGELLTVDEVINLNSTRRYTHPVWPSEGAGLQALMQPGKEKWANNLVVEEIQLLQRDYHVDFDAVRNTVQHELQQSQNQEWLNAVRQAQELRGKSVH